MPSHQIHVWPWLRVPGRLLLRDWLAITLGRHILAWRRLSDAELAHELEHVRQWKRHGPLFPIVYLAEALRTRSRGKRWYHDNKYEVEAREASKRIGNRPR